MWIREGREEQYINIINQFDNMMFWGCNMIEWLQQKMQEYKNMELRLLRYFLTVAKEQSFTKAAEQLHIVL